MIGLSAIDADENGDLVVRDVDLSVIEPVLARRATLEPALDGGLAVDDTGFFWSDQEITVKINGLTKDMRDSIVYLVTTYSELYLSVYFGFFLVQVESFSPGTAELKLRTKRRL